MNGRIAAVASFLFAALMQVGANSSHAAPVSYSFSTGPQVGISAQLPFATFSSALFGGASGTFLWDSAAQFVVTNADGSSSYAGFTSPSMTGLTPSISNLSATIGSGALAFSDPNGSTTVWNDTTSSTFAGSPLNSDALVLSFDPPSANGNQFPRNISGFDLAGWRLYSARMFWAESRDFTAFGSTTNPTPDFLDNQSLPAVLPAFSGFLLLEFQNIANPSAIGTATYFGLQVNPSVAAIPEPETYAMLLAGLGLLGFAARRRKQIFA
jgi:hypothetical protein